MHFPLAEHRRLLGAYLKLLWVRALLLAGLVALSIGLQLFNPQVIRYFIDATQGAAAPGTLLVAAVAYLVVGLSQHSVALIASYISMDVGWQATNLLRVDLARHVLRLDMPFHKRRTPGELIERVDGDVTALAEFFAEFVVRVAGNSLLIVAIVLLVAREDLRAGGLIAVYVVVTLVALYLVQRVGAQRWVSARQAWAEQFGFLEEHIAGSEDIRGIGGEPYVLQRLYGVMRAVTTRARGGWMALALGYVVTNFLYVVGYGLGLALGAFLYLQGAVTIGAAFVLVYYVGMLAAPLEALRGQGEILQQATAGVQRITELLHMAPQVRDDEAAMALSDGPLAVTFDHVSFAYADGDNGAMMNGADGQPLRVLHDISLHLEPGRVLGLLGRTGSGKSTLTRLLFRLYDPTAGAIYLDGVPLYRVGLQDLRHRVGMVTQEVQLFQATLRDNITLFDRSITDEEIEAALAMLGLAGWLHAMPDGLDMMLASGGYGLSAGEAQLLAFTRVLLRDPGLVILDEAASRLDPVTERRLEQAIDRLLENRTAIVIAHRLHTVQRADDILILDGGRVAEYGSRAALAANGNSRFAHLLRTGMEEVLA